MAGEDTPCQSLFGEQPSSSTGGGGDAMASDMLCSIGQEIQTVILRLPKFDNTNLWQTFPKTVSGPWGLFQSVESGWTVTFLKIQNGPNPEVSPSYLPVHAEPNPAQTAVTAAVILPEDGHANQYWVTVQECNGWARLRTPNWDVTFIKRPKPVAIVTEPTEAP